MKDEYFMQVKITKKDEESGMLDKIVQSFEEKINYYAQPNMIALSMDAGMCLSYLMLSPLTEKDRQTGEDVKWYMFRMTSVTSKMDYDSLDDLAFKLQKILTSKIGESQVGKIYRVTATDVPEYFSMIRNQKVF